MSLWRLPTIALLAQFTTDSGPQHVFWHTLLLTIVYGVLGIFLIVLGFKVFDWITPKIDVEVELTEKHNIAVAIVMAAVILGVSIMVAAVIHG